MTAALSAFTFAGARREVALIGMLFLIILLMIVPLPTAVVDALIAANLTLAIILVVIGVSLRDPLELTTLPAVILISVIFRLALSITTTRLILATGDAGQIIKTFGDFVVFGNLVVGLVIFLIITVVQFLVITKGAERVAEVAARFSLDGLPGKQMAIDSDLRSGLISVDEARARRGALEQQMQFYGAMDGAMKFVKGDAIAGIVIIAINLLGGLAIGTLQRGMGAGEALDLYALLTVGDGLVSQIPALMLSITAGVIVTRVGGEERQTLGADIGLQLFAQPMVLRIAGLALLIFAFLPGLPWLIFVSISAGLMVGAELVRRRESVEAEGFANSQTGIADGPAEAMKLAPMPMSSVDIAPDLADGIGRERLTRALDAFRARFFEEMGVWHPPVVARIDSGLEEGRFVVRLEGVPRRDGRIVSDALYLPAARAPDASLAGVALRDTDAAAAGQGFVAVDLADRHTLDAAGIPAMEPEDVLVDLVESVARTHAATFVGVEETRLLLTGLERHAGELVRQALSICPIERIAQVLQALAEDGVSIRNLRSILNALIEWAPQETDPALLAEYIRTSLKAQISSTHGDGLGVIAAWLIDGDCLEKLRSAIHDSAHGSYLALDQKTTRGLLSALAPMTGGDAAETGAAQKQSGVILAPIDLRRLLQKFLRHNDVATPVLSYQDVSSDAKLHCMGTISF